jgi:hypothetical protein
MCCRNGMSAKYGSRSLKLISGILYNTSICNFGNIFGSDKEAIKRK